MVDKNLLMLEIKKRILKMIMFVSIISFTLVAFINLINDRPLSNFVIPLLGGVFFSALFWLFNRNKYRVAIKYFYLVFLNIVYLPLAWLTSPGSYSAMSFYSLLIVLVGVLLAVSFWDYIFPLISVVEVLILLNYEPKMPEQFHIYSALEARAIDLSINFLVASSIIFAIIIVMNSYFSTEHKRVYHLSITDQLTGIFNRRYLYHYLEKFKHKSPEVAEDHVFTILMMDLDNFKLINDTYGHLEGDEVLKKFGDVLNQACRKNDFPARFGGDEFVIILPETSEIDTEIIQKRIVDLFSETLNKYKNEGLAISFGVSVSHGKSIEEMMQQADDHLYKNKGKFKPCCASNEFTTESNGLEVNS